MKTTEKEMSVFEEIKTGLNQAIEYEKNNPIEEMAVDVSNAWQFANQRNRFPNRRPLCDVVAEELYEMEYRKFPKGAVVLSKEDFEKLNSLAKECIQRRWQSANTNSLTQNNSDVQEMRMTRQTYDAVLELVRKETVRKILDEVSKRYGGTWLVELYKRYGIQEE